MFLTVMTEMIRIRGRMKTKVPKRGDKSAHEITNQMFILKKD